MINKAYFADWDFEVFCHSEESKQRTAVKEFSKDVYVVAEMNKHENGYELRKLSLIVDDKENEQFEKIKEAAVYTLQNLKYYLSDWNGILQTSATKILELGGASFF